MANIERLKEIRKHTKGELEKFDNALINSFGEDKVFYEFGRGVNKNYLEILDALIEQPKEKKELCMHEYKNKKDGELYICEEPMPCQYHTKKEKWEPKKNEIYWFVNIDFGKVQDSYPESCAYYEDHLKIGNCFQTKEQAEEARDKIKKILLNN